MPRRVYKHKLLLDENFPLRNKLRRCNHRFNLKHLTGDLKLSGLTDSEIYSLAQKLRRLIVTFNDKDFRLLIFKSQNTGVIGVSANITHEQIDKKLMALLTKSGPKELYGKFTYISGETVGEESMTSE